MTKHEPRIDTKSEQRIKLSTLARAALQEAGGSKTKAVSDLAKRLESDTTLLRSVLLAALDEVADQFVRNEIRTDRREIFAAADRAVSSGRGYAPPAPGPVSTPTISVREIGTAASETILDMPLYDNVALRDANRPLVIRFGTDQGKQGSRMLRTSKFMMLIAARLPDDAALVSAHVDDATALALWSKVA
jgi:hypothetical protein